MTPDAISVTEAASRLGVGRTKLYENLSSGELASFYNGRRRLIPVDSIKDFIAHKVAEARNGDASASDPPT